MIEIETENKLVDSITEMSNSGIKTENNEIQLLYSRNKGTLLK